MVIASFISYMNKIYLGFCNHNLNSVVAIQLCGSTFLETSNQASEHIFSPSQMVNRFVFRNLLPALFCANELLVNC